MPCSNHINRWIAAAIELFKNHRIAMTPLTALNKPKSATPTAAKINLVAYNEIKKTVIALRVYNIPVF